jgi:hypothetical protein
MKDIAGREIYAHRGEYDTKPQEQQTSFGTNFKPLEPNEEFDLTKIETETPF